MERTAFLLSLLSSAAICIVLIFAHSWLSSKPWNYVVYYPNRIRRGLGPPQYIINHHYLFWILESCRASENDLITMGGLDATVYIIFLRSMFAILGMTACYSLPVCLVVSLTEGNNHDDALTSSTLDRLTIGNIQRKSVRMWAFVVGAYWMSICTWVVLWKSGRHVIGLRMRELKGAQAHNAHISKGSNMCRPEQFAILVRDIPEPKPIISINKARSSVLADDGLADDVDGAATAIPTSYAQEVDAFFRKLHPDTYVRSQVVVDIKKISKIWKEMEKYRRKLARAEVDAAVAGHRRLVKQGWLGLWGERVDFVEIYKAKVEELLLQWEMEKETTLKERQMGAAFVVFNSRVAACLATRKQNTEAVGRWITTPAPDPKDVMWKNIGFGWWSRTTRKWAVCTIVVITICIHIVPMVAIAGVINLKDLERIEVFHFLRTVLKARLARTLISAYLPQLALLGVLEVLSSFLSKLSKVEGLACASHRGLSVSGKFFYFSVFNVLLGVTLASSVFKVLKDILDHPSDTLHLLVAAIPPQSTFFITFISLKFSISYGLRLSRVMAWVVYHLKRKFKCKTLQEEREAWMPKPLNYAKLMSGDMMVVVIAISYAIISPMILPFTIAYFTFALLIMQNQVLNVNCPLYESMGRMWPHMQARVLGALFLSQMVMLGYFVMKSNHEVALTMAMAALPLATIMYAWFSHQNSYPMFIDMPLSIACDADSTTREMVSHAHILTTFVPTCLAGIDTFDIDHDDKFEDAKSNISSSHPSSRFMSPTIHIPSSF